MAFSLFVGIFNSCQLSYLHSSLTDFFDEEIIEDNNSLIIYQANMMFLLFFFCLSPSASFQTIWHIQSELKYAEHDNILKWMLLKNELKKRLLNLTIFKSLMGTISKQDQKWIISVDLRSEERWHFALSEEYSKNILFQ